ncbi:tryptophan--tRNA ligase [Thermaurantimonas aggregans]|uniref:Tryptophan--tRNA ligase n=1 Tax=Thermaurantimonas aggregans TaxID=2173829 RepID=A0A401XI30_9FLAO|nr:tryptophan--tRNA ligase [Thermaurantimonas aggregans]GCD76675.1 tryptophan--tRNA ligase [Thermaurantimonas aggregans]
MPRYLTGVQSSGQPHLGNVLGAIAPAIEFSKQPDAESFFFIADFHSLTTIKDGELRRKHTRSVAAAWLACGFDAQKNVFYRQSDLPEVTELAWYLSCFTPYPMLANAHSFKEKSDRLSDVNAGLFNYPVLMAADILLYDADFVPVGKDQKQHLEITRDIASAVNHAVGQEILKLPDALIREDVMTIPGIDGRKMSKSYKNTIDIFAPENMLKKQVMSIVTDSTPLEQPKNPDTCNVFALYKLLAAPDQIAEMRKKYEAGGYGYGHAKKELLALILEKYASARSEYTRLMNDKAELENLLRVGAEKARAVGSVILHRVRQALGF